MKTDRQQISSSSLRQLSQTESIDNLTFEDLVTLFSNDFHPVNASHQQNYQIDPRNNEPVVFNPGRALRPNGYTTKKTSSQKKNCPICEGRTTGILDIAPLSEGFTFINKNLYPMVTPFQLPPEKLMENQNSPRENSQARGFHFLQWTSSFHDHDWHNMPIEDNMIAMQRLGALEKRLLSDPFLQPQTQDNSERPSWVGPRFVSIIKNVGDQIGGSLPHGHQQILLSNIMPRRVKENKRFLEKNGVPFAAFLLSKTPQALIVRDYGPAVLVVPYFMRRPFDMMLCLRDNSLGHIYDLSPDELRCVVTGWRDATLAIRAVMADIGRELAFNVITHNGSEGGLYFEFLPYTQETGGYEQLGLVSCQSDPLQAASRLKSLI